MKLDKHRLLVGTVVASVFTAVGGSTQAAAQSSLRTAARVSASSRFEAWLALRDRRFPEAAASAQSRLAGGADANSRFRSPTAPTVAVGANPVAVAVDYATDTVYVGNGNDGTVSVINGATCNASHVSGCGQTAPTITVGSGPVDDAVDQRTDTVYVTNLGSNTISVIDGDTCNAHNHSGCHRTPPTISVGNFPDGVAIDEATHTVYVANVGDNTVSVINGATCNARVTWGCGQVPPTVAVGVQPAVPAVDEATDTVYVPNSNPGGPGSVSVIDGATCNASVTTGCGTTPPTVALGANTFPVAAAVDQATDTVYETVYGPSTGTTTTLGSVDVIDGATCNASVTSGCGQTPKSVTVGSDPIGVVVDPITESVFVLNEEDSTVSVVDGAICNAVHSAGCSQHPPDIATGFNPGYLDVDLATDTVYASNQGLNDVSVLNGAACTSYSPIWLSEGRAHHNCWCGSGRDRRGRGHAHRVRHEPERRHPLGHQRGNLQCFRAVGLWTELADCGDRHLPAGGGHRPEDSHGIRRKPGFEHRIRHQWRNLQRDQPFRVQPATGDHRRRRCPLGPGRQRCY